VKSTPTHDRLLYRFPVTATTGTDARGWQANTQLEQDGAEWRRVQPSWPAGRHGTESIVSQSAALRQIIAYMETASHDPEVCFQLTGSVTSPSSDVRAI